MRKEDKLETGNQEKGRGAKLEVKERRPKENKTKRVETNDGGNERDNNEQERKNEKNSIQKERNETG